MRSTTRSLACSKVNTYAEKVVEGKNELFQAWLAYHSYHFPEDKQILGSLIDEGSKLPVDIETITFGEMITKLVPKKKKKSTKSLKPVGKRKKNAKSLTTDLKQSTDLTIPHF